MPRKMNRTGGSFDLGTTNTSPSLHVLNYNTASIQIVVPSGTFVIESSNDSVNWDCISDEFTVTDSFTVIFTSLGMKYLRVKYSSLIPSTETVDIVMENIR